MNNNFEKYIEHTLLKPSATLESIKKHLDEAITYNFLGVCINPTHIKYSKEYLGGKNIKVVTVIGFPLGANTTETKVFETKNAVDNGADELDMVINIGALKDKNYKLVEQDINAVVQSSSNHPVKVIIETDLLDKDEIIEACKLSANAGASFVKTSTGFVCGGKGATAENVKLMYETVKPYGLKVKASGGVKTQEDCIAMINAGACRIGTSSGVKLVGGC